MAKQEHFDKYPAWNDMPGLSAIHQTVDDDGTLFLMERGRVALSRVENTGMQKRVLLIKVKPHTLISAVPPENQVWNR